MSQQSQPGGALQYNIGRCKEHSCNCQNFYTDNNNQNLCVQCKHDIVPDPNYQNRYLENPIHSSIELHTDHQDHMNQMHQPVREQPPPNTIWFYNRNEEYYEFTNFKENFPINISIGEISNSFRDYFEVKSWPTSEHLFQAAKFKESNPEIVEQIRKCRSPRDALNLARNNQHLVDPNWQDINVNVMKWVVKNKFTQHRKLAERLLSTGDKILVEHTNIDKFWGDGGDGKGLNWLGRILMEVREELKTQFQFPTPPPPSSHSMYNVGLGQNGSDGNISIPPKLPPRRPVKRDLSKFHSNQNKDQQYNQSIQNKDQQYIQNQQYNQDPNQIQYVIQPPHHFQSQQQLQHQHFQQPINQPSDAYYTQYSQQNLNNNPNM
ncbi:9425_t:CDS:2 [Gigaspora margarita]|uniref:9425_t:CDS:1 n=1 Tax=Gigaspora margarita TaxID=4874 RepID=A0ABN7UB20_GIGMA|nr:9425_t:CDS:2 [Gigaspora margarita]